MIDNVDPHKPPDVPFEPGFSNTTPISTSIKGDVGICPPIDILRRPETLVSFANDMPSHVLYPRRPYHERLAYYLQRRNEIFSLSSLNSISSRRPRRSTIRLRQYFRSKRLCRKFLVSAIFSKPTDMRYFAKISFLEFNEFGLLDTGASVSCLGAELALHNFSKYQNFSKCRSNVSTADGSIQRVVGWIDVLVSFKGDTRPLRFFIIPSLSQRVILGIDFWKKFGLIPDILGSVVLMADGVISTSVQALNPEGVVLQEDFDTDSFPLTGPQRKQLQAVINLFPNFETQGLGRTRLIRHSIDVGDASPVKQRYYPVSPAVERLMFGEIDRMLSLGVIEPSTSAWSSPMRLVVKPGKVRLCLDARRLNAVTIKDAYPLPNIEGIFARLPKANIISKLDLKDAFWQISLDEKSRPLTAFTVPGRPLYQFVVMPFGLCNAPQTMCRLMDEIIPPDLRHCVFGYLDDLVIVSEDFPSHMEVLVRISAQFRRANLSLNVSKSKFCVTRVNYLGYVIGNGGITTDPEKVAAITNWPVPKTLKQVRGFLGLTGWYRRFVPNFSDATFHITEVLKSRKKFQWTPEAQLAFEDLKGLLTSAPVLSNPDFTKKFYLHCDASDHGIGAVLVQLDKDGQEKPIAFMSKKLTTAQRNYSVTERECLAAVEAIKKFRCYLELQEFEVVTDHSSLLWLMRQPDLSGRLARWVFKLQSYRFSISHRKGSEHVVPDALSRIPHEEVAGIDTILPEVDLESPFFLDEDYVSLRARVFESQSSLPDLRIVDKYVYYRTEPYSGEERQEQDAWKLWIPLRLREDTISRAHDSPVTAHGGIAKTVDLLRRHFFWPGMVKDVRRYVGNCEVCKTTKAPNTIMKPPMVNQSVSERPFQRLYIDLLGPYPRSKSGYIGLLIVLDHFSKFHWVCPLRKFTSSAIKDFLQSQIFHIYGVPETVISDNGSQFKANDLNAFLTSFGINHIYTAFYSPQANASERVNRSLIAGIRAFLKKDHREWDQNLSAICCALRNAVLRTMSFSGI